MSIISIEPPTVEAQINIQGTIEVLETMETRVQSEPTSTILDSNFTARYGVPELKVPHVVVCRS